MKILSSRGPVLQFLLEDTDPAFANSLRRIMMAEVPTMAMQWVDFHENGSALFDEIISHRIGLIPLKFDPKKFNLTADCECKGKGCPLCEVVFVIDKKGPGTATAADLKSSNRAVAPVDPRIPIVQLLDGQALRLEAVARLGIGSMHAKHHAASASYQYYPEISFSGTREEAKKAADACPRGALEADGTKLLLKDPFRCDLCRSCLEAAKGVTVSGDESRIIFRVESVSGLEPEYIVTKAAQVIRERADEFRRKIAAI